jgi:hypothetical protein
MDLVGLDARNCKRAPKAVMWHIPRSQVDIEMIQWPSVVVCKSRVDGMKGKIAYILCIPPIRHKARTRCFLAHTAMTEYLHIRLTR